MNRSKKLAALRDLQAKADALRQELGISAPGKVTFLAKRGIENSIVIVECDGFGRAATCVVEGNYPVDYLTVFKRTFTTEKDAEMTAAAVAFEGVPPSEYLGEAV